MIAMTTTQPEAGGRAQGRRALFGWSPPDLPADTALRRRADRVLPRTGPPAAAYCAVVVGLLFLAPNLPERGNLAVDGLAALAASAWCGVNLWRCRHAHCVVTSTGWLALSVVAFIGAAIGHSLIGGYEQPVFLAVLAASVLFEAGWRMARGTSALGRGTGTRRGTGAAGCGPGAAACGTGAFPGRRAS
jgi:hypothetical protein